MVACAVAVGGKPGKPGALDRLPGGGTRNRRRVEQAQPVAERRREPRYLLDSPQELGCERPQALVEARLARDVGKQMTEPALGEAQEAALFGAVE